MCEEERIDEELSKALASSRDCISSIRDLMFAVARAPDVFGCQFVVPSFFVVCKVGVDVFRGRERNDVINS